MNTKHTQAWAMLAQAIVNIDEGHTTIEPGSAVHDGMKDLLSDPVYKAAPDLLEALQAVLQFDSQQGIPGEYKHDVTTALKVRAAIAKATQSQVPA